MIIFHSLPVLNGRVAEWLKCLTAERNIDGSSWTLWPKLGCSLTVHLAANGYLTATLGKVILFLVLYLTWSELLLLVWEISGIKTVVRNIQVEGRKIVYIGRKCVKYIWDSLFHSQSRLSNWGSYLGVCGDSLTWIV